MLTLTIIIPSYNTVKFMDSTIHTFVDPSLEGRVEVLIINDGSTDNTYERALEFQEKYPRLIKVIDKMNGGHGSVINLGTSLARGKYIKVVDGDDWVSTKGLLKLVDDLEKSEADVILNPYYEVDVSDKSKKKLCKEDIEPGVYKFEEIESRFSEFRIHNITLKKSIMKNYKITEHCFYDDFEYALFPVPYIYNVQILDYAIYYYLTGQSSQSVSDASVLKNHMMERTILYDSIKYYFNVQNSLNQTKQHFFEKNIARLGRQTYNIYLRNYKNNNSYDMYKDFDRELFSRSKSFYDLIGKRNPYIAFLRKHNYFAFCFVARLLRIYKIVTR